MSNRKQAVQYQGKLSQYKDLTVGIPQGSALGPTLFLIFFNDISEYLKNGSCNVFADDVVIYVSGKTVSDVNLQLQMNMNEIRKWYLNNRLRINIDKTKVMLLKSQSVNEINVFIDKKG